MDRRPDRRQFLALAGASLTAGCGQYDGPANVWPEPTVLDHFRGDPHVRSTRRTLVLGGTNRYEATVENTGHDAHIRVRLHWVTEGGHDPGNLTGQQLREAGYVVTDERIVRIGEGERRDVQLRGTQPEDAFGYLLRTRNLTYGATVGNGGGAGTVEATLVDTTDLDDTRVLGRKTLTLPADESIDVSFRSAAPFEVFRVDVSTQIVQ